MNQGRIWTVVSPTVGLPLIIGSAAVTSLLVHYAILSHTTLVSGVLGRRTHKVAMDTSSAAVSVAQTGPSSHSRGYAKLTKTAFAGETPRERRQSALRRRRANVARRRVGVDERRSVTVGVARKRMQDQRRRRAASRPAAQDRGDCATRELQMNRLSQKAGRTSGWASGPAIFRLPTPRPLICRCRASCGFRCSRSLSEWPWFC